MSQPTRTIPTSPDDVSRLVVERARAGDAEGIAALYAEDAVCGFPPGRQTVGRPAIQALYETLLADPSMSFRPEEPLPTLVHGDLALTGTRSKDGTGTRSQVLRRQPDGGWLRVLDRPESAT